MECNRRVTIIKESSFGVYKCQNIKTIKDKYGKIKNRIQCNNKYYGRENEKYCEVCKGEIHE
jgi:hypothetical protein